MSDVPLVVLQGGFHERCMLPLIDMCNHDSNDTTCRLRVRLTPSGQPRSTSFTATIHTRMGPQIF